MYKCVLFILLLLRITCYAQFSTYTNVSQFVKNSYPVNQNGTTDTTLLTSIVTKFNSFSATHITEKTYLQLDKPYYSTGDTIYFKAYVTVGAGHKLSALSGVLNVDLIKSDDKLCRSIKLKLTDGVGWGDFALDDSLRAGNYRIRGYTNWMRNAGEAYFFNQNLPVVNGYSSNRISGKPDAKTSETNMLATSHHNKNKYDVQLFPEGGTLINGLPTKIAFKAISSNGLGANISGIVKDGEGHEVVSFTSQHLGMGEFTLNPEAGKTYKATVTFTDGQVTVFDLPKAVDTGYTLTINSFDSTRLRVNIEAGKSTPAGQLFLVAQSGGVIYYTAKSSAGSKDMNAVIPTSKFPTGIIQFTLFSSTGEPLNERLVFIDHHDLLSLNISTPLQSYAPRQKIKISLDVKDKDGKPATGLFSVSVTDEAKVQVNENTENTIVSNLLLTSDIKGYVEQPNYYFIHSNDKTRADLDVLMLTQGYHRFEWKQVLDNNVHPITFQPEKILYLSGTIKTRWNKPIPHAKISMLSTGDGFLSRDTVADANGRFKFTRLLMRDSIHYLIQAEDKKYRQNSIISIDSTTAPVSKNLMIPVADNRADSALLVYRQNSEYYHTEQDKQGIGRHAIALKGVEIKDKKKLKYLEHSSNLRGPGNADQVVTADDLPIGCPVFTDCISKLLHNVNFYSNNSPGRAPPMIILDGIALNDDGRLMQENRDMLDAINTNDIASIEVLSNASSAGVYGVRAAGGVVIITTKRGDDEQEIKDLAPGIMSYSPKGFYKARSFYSPRYDVSTKNTNHPDLRTTIYWNPNLITDKDGKTYLEFFNADGKGTYRIVVEGIDSNGNLGRGVYRYTVK